ncbi:hypothetical protein [Crassaminicella profunda]|uniref:hypothetical protein n=1 Tax=Crassaminicella profunda TaxID=1286698 RepID=UPI001CA6E71E|nr:hypothetical protein [Crassaminicella profunda]QZY56640.1 hypothetical protein K7H06_06895 [Crassaminicella profunda]
MKYGRNIQLDLDFLKSRFFNIYMGKCYDKNSIDGFTRQKGFDGKYYDIRIRYIKLDKTNYGPFTKAEEIISIAKGKTVIESKTVTKTTSYLKTWEHSAGINLSIVKDVLDLNLGSKYCEVNGSSESTTTFKSTEYSFSSDAPAGSNMVTYYAGIINDKYEVVTDIVPVKNPVVLKL